MASFFINFDSTALQTLTGSESGVVGLNGSINIEAGAAVTMNGATSLTVLGYVGSATTSSMIDAAGTSTSLLIGAGGVINNALSNAVTMSSSVSAVITNLGLVRATEFALQAGSAGRVVIENAGTLISDLTTVVIDMADDTRTAFILNTGTMSSRLAAIDVSTGALRLQNTGTISSATPVAINAADGLASGIDAIYNSGEIFGDVNLYAGEDIFANRAGTLHGRLGMGSGNDVVSNYGVITGPINLSEGDDIFRSYGGTIHEFVDGGIGNDTYVVDDADIRIFESPGEGNDLVRSSVTFQLPAFSLVAFIEQLQLTGSAAIDGFGNEQSNTITGNAAANRLEGLAGNDTLTGGFGADTLIGGAGNDTYVDVAGDIFTELTGEGIDTIQSSVTFSIAALANFENITLTGAGLANATGNAGANRLTGNENGNTLDGAAGADTMLGGAGGDVYVVDNAGDQTIELSGEGTDAVVSSLSRTLGDNLERLTLSGAAAIDGNGNTLANEITGNSGNNILRGDAQNDTLFGGGGNDILLGGTGRDTLDPGNDAVQDIIRYSAVNESSGTTRDLVLGLHLDAEDKIDLTVVVTSLNFISGGNLSTATFNADLAAAVNGSLDANGAVLLNPAAGDLNLIGHVYVVVDANGDGNYSSGLDYVIQLENPTGTLTLDDFI